MLAISDCNARWPLRGIVGWQAQPDMHQPEGANTAGSAGQPEANTPGSAGAGPLTRAWMEELRRELSARPIEEGSDVDPLDKVQGWLEQFPLGHLSVLRDESRGPRGEIIGPLHNFSNLNLRVTLVTYGTEEHEGMDYMAQTVKDYAEEHECDFNGMEPEEIMAKLIQCTHCLDRIFQHQDHLSSRGRHISGQAEFIDIYRAHFGDDVFYEFFRSMVYKIHDSIADSSDAISVLHLLSCRHGHHRSQAFGELLKKLLRHHFPFLRVDLWHLDEKRFRWPHEALSDPAFEKHFKFPLLKARLSIVEDFKPARI